jgi:hypothetical protein
MVANMRKIILVFTLLSTGLLFVSCGGGDDPYPAPGDEQPSEDVSNDLSDEPYPEPDQPKDLVAGSSQFENEYAPQPEDSTLSRGEAYIDSSDILLLESQPVQVQLLLNGNLPNPCYQLRAQVLNPDDQNRIDIEVYSVVDPEMICAEVLEPFEARIPIGSYSDGIFTVWLNGEEVGTFNLSED